MCLAALVIGIGIGYFAGTRSLTPVVQTQMTGMDMPGMHGTMDGMTAGLEGKSGDELDLAFLDEMIIHHEGAIEMAETLRKGTKRPELTKLGNDIITAQTQEIKMMTEWRMQWFNR